MTGSTTLRWLLISAASSTAALAPAAFAQAPRAPQQSQTPGGAAQAGAGDSLLSEVVITATRQVDTVARVPLAITAVTQKALDQQGVTQIADLTRLVPSLQIVTTGAGGSVGQFAIRGISSTAGAAVTGVYLDDVPLTKRNQNGVSNLNGSPAPPLFDLERVEVLRGPQGTLYGGSSEGGTIRFITPTPSLTTMSGYARGQFSHTDYGGWGYEAGVAVGGPIVEDKLGFRASAFHRRTAGYIDAVNPYSQQVFCKDCNWGTQDVLRAALLWKPTENLSILPSVYAAKEKNNDSSSISESIPSAASIAATGFVPQSLLNVGWGGLQPRCNVLPASPTARTSVTPVQCTGAANQFVYPAHPAPAYDLGKYQSLRGGPTATSPFNDYTELASVTADYDLHFADLKGIFSYFQDQQKAVTYDTSIITPLFDGYPFTVPEYPNWNANGGNFRPDNKRWGDTQEIRLSSAADARPLNWVLGFFHENIRAHGYYNNIEDVQTPTMIITGLSALQRYGAPLINGNYATRDQTLKDTETAFFGEVNWYVTDKLKITGGVRRSEVGFSYTQVFFGPINNSNDPSQIPGGITNGSSKETPVSPKAGIQYQFTPNDQVYFTYSKGYRAGGVNSPVSQGQCGAALATVGLTVDQVPQTFKSDQLASYEVGAKLKMLQNRLAINASGYIIDWTDLQINVGINSNGCGQTWTQNLGAAQSKGVELETQFQVVPGLTVTATASYNDAKYTQSAIGPTPLNGSPPPVFATAGQSLGLQPYRFNLQAQYGWRLMGQWSSYVRADYTYTPRYRTLVFGQTNWNPDSTFVPVSQLVNFRMGVTYKAVDLSFFVNNVFDSEDALGGANGAGTGAYIGGRTGCTNKTCNVFTSYSPNITFTSFRPREEGVQAIYHF